MTSVIESRALRFPLFVLLIGSLFHMMPGAVGAERGVVERTYPAKKPPFYRGSPASPAGSLVHLPITVSLPDGLPADWLPVEALESLADDMNRWLAQTASARLSAWQGSIAPGSGPVVTLGCTLDFSDECDAEDGTNSLHVRGGDKRWREAASIAIADGGFAGLLVLDVQIAPHWIRQANLLGRKEVRLGTRRQQQMPWLASLETPVWVVQVTGSLVDAEGKVVRSGAEGIWALRTPFKISVLRAQQMLREQDIEEVRTTLRDGSVSDRLAWQVALEDLLAGLTTAEN